MKIVDCFMYFDEDLLLELRLKELDKYISKFVIVESKFTHSGIKRKLQFDINKYKKYENKIEYIILNEEPLNLQIVQEDDDYNTKNSKYILNAAARENLQRNTIKEGLINNDPEDWILISDLDEIPNMENVNFKQINNKFLFFEQKNYYYKFNLFLEGIKWVGSKACKLKDLKSPQWLRNIKDKNYSKWRIDTFFSQNKSNDIYFVKNGGWHFSYLKKPEDIEIKLKSYLHHREYDLNPLGINMIKKYINEKIAIYDLKTDMRNNKFTGKQKLKVQSIDNLPIEIRNNLKYYKSWLEE